MGVSKIPQDSMTPAGLYPGRRQSIIDRMKAAIFDLDGLLIDSEPLWRVAETEVFGRVGIPLTDRMCDETMGLRASEVVAHWYRRYPWKGRSLRWVEEQIVQRVESLIRERGTALPGVHGVLSALAAALYPTALASSSSHNLIDAAIETLNLGRYFEIRCSASDEKHGKPHPAVYLSAAARLGVDPTTCVAFEDSIAGLRAGKAAGMTVVAIPARGHYEDSRYDQADLKLKSLVDFSLDRNFPVISR